jgi:hypothetical protein
MPRPKGLPKTGGKKKGTPNGASIVKAAQHIESVKLTVDRVLQEYGHIALFDPAEMFDAEGRYLPVHLMPPHVRRAIAGLEVVDYGEDGDGKGVLGKLHKIKIIDKTKALHDLAQHLGMFIDKLQLSGSVTISNRETLARELDERRKRRLSAGA